MKLEVGQFYRTRDGRKAWVTYREIGTSNDGGDMFLGIIEGEGFSSEWCRDGEENIEGLSRDDLIAPWGEE